MSGNKHCTVAYFSAEIGLTDAIPTFSGGLGVLAGDHIKSAADLNLPLCGITLLYREGYFKQSIDEQGRQSEFYPEFDPADMLTLLPERFTVRLRGTEVALAAWVYEVEGLHGHTVPVFFIDADLPENDADTRQITRRLYSGGDERRVMQEAILGIGGVRLLDALGFDQIETYHMNEGHTALLTLELLRKWQDQTLVRDACLFTTHTPVAAGHDLFSEELVVGILDGEISGHSDLLFEDGVLNMTNLGLLFSRAANGVSRLHGDVAQRMFPDHEVGHVTNGVHHLSWASTPTANLLDEYVPAWREEPSTLVEAVHVPDEAIAKMRTANKAALLEYIAAVEGIKLGGDILTIGFARRAAEYKRAYLLFTDPERLLEICGGRLQVVFAGKAHPNDKQGKSIIEKVVLAGQKLKGRIEVVYLQNYNISLGMLITSGVDLWLNNPLRPNEASGTSGMKAILNGVPNLSTLDGWWAEGCRDGWNGWSFGDPDMPDNGNDAEALYTALESKVLPLFYDSPEGWRQMARQAIATSAQYTSQRMVLEYRELYQRQ